MIQMRGAKPGFSFIEIMVAVMIIGIMIGSAVGLFSFLGKARRTAVESTLRSLKTAITVYQTDVGAYPSSLKELVERPSDPKFATKWKGPYLDKEIVNDSWGHEFQYYANAPKSAYPYELYSWGADGEGAPEEQWVKAWDL